MNKIHNTVHLFLSYVGFAHCKYMIPSYNGKEEVCFAVNGILASACFLPRYLELIPSHLIWYYSNSDKNEWFFNSPQTPGGYWQLLAPPNSPVRCPQDALEVDDPTFYFS